MTSRALVALIVLAAAGDLGAQGVRSTGRLDTLVTATEDTTQHYAVFLPSTYE